MMDYIRHRPGTAGLISQEGYSLFELLIVIVVIGIISTVTLKSLGSSVEVARVSETTAELDQIAYAIAGDPALVTGGGRTDFGYVGDVGSLPPNLDAQISNPGGYATWDGPYLRDEFYNTTTSSAYAFKTDAWSAAYNYSGLTITSTGSGSSLTRRVANHSDDLLYNSVNLTITDNNGSPPGTTYRDSLRVVLSCPDGTGSIINRVKYPAADGSLTIDSIPIGSHNIAMIYLPTNDTILHRALINPGQAYFAELRYYEDVW